jgi:hypothetical protein
MENVQITLNLTIAQCNIVLNALAGRPYGEVADVITVIKSQGEQALEQAKEAPEAVN